MRRRATGTGRWIATAIAMTTVAWVALPASSAAATPSNPQAVMRPVTAPKPDPFNGAIPGDATAPNAALPPVKNPPDAGPFLQTALPGAHVTQTRFGPVDDMDRLFLVKVRQAGLWERPTCLRAQDQAESPRLKEICQTLASDHAQLDEEDRFIATQLGVALPDQPSLDQQGWMREFWDLKGHEFDVDSVRWLRFAHGVVYGAIATIRTGTRNEMMRLFAERASTMVNKHMSLLESTGLVQYDALPHAAIGGPAAGLANAKVPTQDFHVNRTQQDIDGALTPKNPSLLRPSVIALMIVTGLLAAVSIRRVVRGGS
jgi:putative membrane protein